MRENFLSQKCAQKKNSPGDGHKQASRRWLGEPDPFANCCICETANNTPLSSISLLIFIILDCCKVFKLFKRL